MTAALFALLVALAAGPAADAANTVLAAIPRPPIMAQAAEEEAYDFVVETIPAIEGITVTLDGRIRETGPDGTATFRLQEIGGESDIDAGERLVIATEEVQLDERTIARYARRVPRKTSVTLMYSRYYLTEFTFTDANSAPVSNQSIETTMVKSSTGEAIEIDVNEDVWLVGSRVAGSAKPLVKQVFWTINDVIVDDSSVAHRGQTKFFPEDEPLITSQLLLFHANFEIVDAFFGFPVGDSLTIESPAGDVMSVDLEDGKTSINQMPRGEYQVIVEGNGLRIERPITLTRNQDLRLLYYTRLDVILVALVLIGFIVIPILIGRRRHRKHRADDADDAGADGPDEDEATSGPAAVTSHKPTGGTS